MRINLAVRFLARALIVFVGLGLVPVGEGAAAPQCLRVFVDPQARFPHHAAAPSPAPRLLEAGEPLGEIRYLLPGGTRSYTLEEYLSLFCTTGFLVLKEGRVVFERYLQGTGPGTVFLSASVAKTVLSVLVGIAISDGRLSLDRRVAEVLPDFSRSAFADATVEALLRMSASVALVNSYEPGQRSDNQAINPILNPQQSARTYLRGLTERTPETAGAPPFDYNGAVSAVLGLMLREANGETHAAFLEKRLWRPMGAESRAFWLINRHGEEAVQGHFAATLRDYGRFGLLLQDAGRVVAGSTGSGDTQVVPDRWIRSMAELRKDRAQPKQAPFYGLHVWIPYAAGGRMFAWGTNGQNIFVDPIAKVVIVHTGNSPKAAFDGNAHLFALRDAIVRHLSTRDQAPRRP